MLEVHKLESGTWVEVVAPTEDEQRALVEKHGLHPLALRVSLRKGYPPRFGEFGEDLFVVLRTALLGGGKKLRKVAIFVGPSRVITILREELPELQLRMQQLRRSSGAALSSPAFLLHGLLDVTSSGFERIADKLHDRLDTLEMKLDSDAGDLLSRLLAYRQDLLALSRIVRRQRDVAFQVASCDHPTLPEAVRPYMRDAANHLMRVNDLIETSRDGVLALRDTHLSLVNNRLSEVMRVLTVIATIMMPLTLMAGVYGMNVVGLPGEKHPYTFWVLSGAMIGLAVGMLLWFRKKRWI